jgi:hypothetical protein
MHKTMSENNTRQDLPEGLSNEDGANSHRSANEQQLHTGRMPKSDDNVAENAIKIK